jgi:hypothetical protein
MENWMVGPELKKAQEIRAMLAKKQEQYLQACEQNRTNDAVKIEKEYKALLTELKFVNPTADLTDEELELKEMADQAQAEDIMERSHEE